MNDIRRRLLAAFQAEHREHLERIRAILAGMGEGGAPGPGLDEAFRRAHSLKGAARAVDLRPVETLAHRLETLFSRVREGALALDGETARLAQRALDEIEDMAATLLEGRTPSGPSGAQEALEGVLGAASEGASPLPSPPEASAPAGPLPSAEAVRVRAEDLDRLLRSAGQLLVEGLRQDAVTQGLEGIARQVADLERGWQRMQRGSGASRLTPEFSRVAGYLHSVDRQVRALSGQVRAVRALQRRNAWSIRQVGRQLQEDVRQARTAPAGSVFEGFRKMVWDLARDEGKGVEFEVSGLDVEADRMVLQALKDPLMHLLRNAVIHGIERPQERERRGKPPAGRVTLRVESRGNRLGVGVEDDGGGIDLRRVAGVAAQQGLLSGAGAADASPQELARLIFRPGFSTSRRVTDLSGRGMGLSVVHEAVARLQGEVEVQRTGDRGTRMALSVPLSVVTHRLLMVACRGQTFGIPAHGIDRLHRVRRQEVETVEGRPVVTLRGETVPLMSLAGLLSIGEGEVQAEGEVLPVAVLKSGERRAGVAVDAFLSVREGLIQDLKAPAARKGCLSGCVLLEDGSVSLALNPAGLVEAFRGSAGMPALKTEGPVPEGRPSTILVVDDSITTRTLEKSILETHGYRVLVAVDGVEALDRLRSEGVDLVVADLQMPRMDGFALLTEMKRDPRLARVPVIVVTSLERSEDRERGLALGADAYIVKRKFDQRELLEAVEQML